MAIPKNKDELLMAIEKDYQKLRLDLHSIPLEKIHLLEMEGHAKDTKMSVHNVVAYLVGWGELVLKWNAIFEKNEVPIFPEEKFKWTELGLLAQKFYLDYQAIPFQNLLIQLDQTVLEIKKIIHSKNNEELYHVHWYKHYSMGRMIQLNTSSPYKNARTRIRKWKKEQKI